MHGNIWEWVEDDWHQSYDGAPADGSAWIDKKRGARRVIRGGSWNSSANEIRAANRSRIGTGTRDRSYGFRVATSELP